MPEVIYWEGTFWTLRKEWEGSRMERQGHDVRWCWAASQVHLDPARSSGTLITLWSLSFPKERGWLFMLPHKSGRDYCHRRECNRKALLALRLESEIAGDSPGRKLQVQWSNAKPSRGHKNQSEAFRRSGGTLSFNHLTQQENYCPTSSWPPPNLLLFMSLEQAHLHQS